MNPQPDEQSRKILTVAVVVTVVLCVLTLCAVVVVCVGPFALFAWFADRQMDWFEEQSGTPFPYDDWSSRLSGALSYLR
ncbi:hypothetical protein GCM10009679_33910 [Saccharothrix algeriensis]|uniref:Uncharacterized protein n=1 Tax=Catellatospora bangladeshensis TaxID=310355 RepID=A0A8J3JPJ6_9ACTN|nr:hypothetical protein Cba03nite_23130 [Catellatospora bangladeshensis]